ncbi:MAG: hypothetical protein KKA60_03895 [Proteobacteria bacterium]|nr:hypothetical protein [Pseudomonadota bacterium]
MVLGDRRFFLHPPCRHASKKRHRKKNKKKFPCRFGHATGFHLFLLELSLDRVWEHKAGTSLQIVNITKDMEKSTNVFKIGDPDEFVQKNDVKPVKNRPNSTEMTTDTAYSLYLPEGFQGPGRDRGMAHGVTWRAQTGGSAEMTMAIR